MSGSIRICVTCPTEIGPRNKSGSCKSCVLRALPHPSIDMEIGSRFGRLTVCAPAGTAKGGQKLWLFRCDCGNEKEIAGTAVRRGTTVSCGCFAHEARVANGKRSLRHGHDRRVNGRSRASRTYSSWQAMRNRCQRPEHTSYARYGGAGITVCERWNKFENFLEDMGERPAGRSLDRIDGTKGYEPGNCRWSTPIEQQLNAKRTILYRLDGELVSQNRAAKMLGVSRWSLQQADHPRLTRASL